MVVLYFSIQKQIPDLVEKHRECHLDEVPMTIDPIQIPYLGHLTTGHDFRNRAA